MNTETKPFNDPAHEREWQAQERALRAERLGGETTDDARVRRYRLLARVLGEPMHESLPADFAGDIARRAEAENLVAATLFSAPFERNLLHALIALFGVTIGIAVVLYGGDSLQTIGAAALRIGAPLQNPWVLAFVACLAISGGLQRWRGRLY